MLQDMAGVNGIAGILAIGPTDSRTHDASPVNVSHADPLHRPVATHSRR
ncbi:protein of unknown function [Modestobacter italicus]|uniref:Uncharacterized protein n=1 Tax=Modestobacter italicus (strain DSM 44449 / CECT 9708 / BC 501) TaxID=2732864 RepID=I4F0I8_MODI5|nr:protein of unknown function [Modestobacter marinus]